MSCVLTQSHVFTSVGLFLLNILHTTIGDSVSLTPLNPSSSIASISLVENGEYHTTTSDGKYQCDAGDHNSFCVYLNIYNNGCDDVETVSVTVNGENINNGNVDLFALFSVENAGDNTIDYFSFFSDWSGGVGATIGGQAGGVFITPDCGHNLLLQTDNIDTLLDKSTNPWTMRQYIAGDTTDDWELLTSQKIGSDAKSVSYTITNDPFNNQITASFDASISTNDFVPVSCTFDNQIFDRIGSGNDYLIAFAVDQSVIEFSQFDVEVTCASTMATAEETSNECVCDNFDDNIQPLNEWYYKNIDNGVYNHLLTTVDQPSNVIDLDYEYIGIEGYVWKDEIDDVTYPLYRHYSTSYGDHYYTMSSDKMAFENYEYKGISGYMMKQSCSEFNQPLYEYWSESKKDHLYNINFNELEMGDGDYEYQRIVGYVAKEQIEMYFYY